jgi:hypothetical protein
MINVTRGSNMQLIPVSEILSPKNLGSPVHANGGNLQGQ